MINNDSDYLSFIFFLIFLFVHPILNVVAIFNVIFFFPGQTPFYFRAIAPAVPSGWNMLIPDLQIFSFVLSFKISTSV